MSDKISKAAAALGRRGGKVTGGTKADAARANGALGGRPAAWETAARRRSGHVKLALDLRRGDDGQVHRLATTLWLDPDGGVRVEASDDVERELAAIQRKVNGQWVDIPGEEWPTPRWLVAGPDVRPVYRPWTDDELAAALAGIAANRDRVIGTLGDWPTELFAGVVELAGSRDRWVTAIGQGGHKDNLPGSYAKADEAEAALRTIIGQRQARTAEIIARRCQPHEVRCAFPAIRVDVIGDRTVVAESMVNRRERRANLKQGE